MRHGFAADLRPSVVGYLKVLNLANAAEGPAGRPAASRREPAFALEAFVHRRIWSTQAAG